MSLMPESQKLETKISLCKACPLWKSRTNPVPGEGNLDAELMLIGEAPGREEDREGRPFVGRAGSILNENLRKAGLKRGDLYITNVVKCRPPGNRNPSPEEASICINLYLQKQIELINPKLIVLLGNIALTTILNRKGITHNHGKVFEHEGRKYLASYHPAAIIYNPSLEESLQKDLQSAKEKG